MSVPAKGKDSKCPGAGADPANPRARQLYWSPQEENGLWNGHCFTQQCSSQAGLSQGSKQDTLWVSCERDFGRVGMGERKTKALAPASSWWPTEALPCRHSFLLISPTSLLCTSGRPARVLTMTTTTQHLLTPTLDWMTVFNVSPDNSRQPEITLISQKWSCSLNQYGQGCPDPPNTLLFLVWYAQTCTCTCQMQGIRVRFLVTTIFSICVRGVYIVYVCICMGMCTLHVHACVQECTYMWSQELNVRCPPWSFSTLFFERGILTKPQAHEFGEAGWPMNWHTGFCLPSVGITSQQHWTMWVMGTQILLFAQQTQYHLSYLLLLNNNNYYCNWKFWAWI